MFLLGTSAHIFTYMLVSAFFFICLYTKGETKDCEEKCEQQNFVVYEYSLSDQGDYFSWETSILFFRMEEVLKSLPPEMVKLFPIRWKHLALFPPCLSIYNFRAPPQKSFRIR